MWTVFMQVVNAVMQLLSSITEHPQKYFCHIQSAVQRNSP